MADQPLAFNAFLMNTPSHIHHGQWRHPDAHQVEFNSLRFWVDLARTLEEGLFDAMFFADVTGLYGPPDGRFADNVTEGLQIPSNDPAVLLSALALATEHIGLAYTSNIMQNPPFNFARQISTLDHLTGGRVAWNIVTSTQENAARNFDLAGLLDHDARYDWADEYLDVLYKLWEGSWDEDAVVLDRAGNRYADPAKVHKIHHRSARYSVEGPHLVAPSPQRTPLLFQAGGSARGIAFAARHAEAVFITTPDPDVAREHIATTRRLATELGRRPDDLRFFQGLTFVVGEDQSEVEAKLADYEAYASILGYQLHTALGTLPDGSHLPDDTPLRAIANNGGRGHVDWVSATVDGREPTLGDLVNSRVRRGLVAGTPEQIADVLADYRDAGVDGINVINWRLPGTYEEFTRLLLPTLQRRGLAKLAYAPGTLRHRIFGTDRLPDRHPAARYRGAYAGN
ncbi:NtaA/DmoA family FMN-dependent monooxygenase [Raineyella fluvialis]|uniref:NtaA/DmoA family FMN-dependent monooxygenase n=1 Tax=Raineyella fluvialis TaxID=2662261 RepID=A0A5Q2FGU1_9ACTN|nr:NtaA/DmoA family FMN-dependent monooxygenase [Raineyella fluvialis]QGF24764.1 NtaA/DmoA family FMN-dependent monooxygenase [Raineyella fluvialis]